MTRDEVLQEIETKLAKGRRVLLVGPRGIGKSWLLQRLAERIQGAVYVPQLKPAKEGLMEIAKGLHAQERLLDFEYYADWNDVRKKLANKPMPRLVDLLKVSLDGAELTLLIDHLEGCTPSLLPYLDDLVSLGPVVAATNDLKDDQVVALLPKFQRYDVPPVTHAEAQAILWSLINPDGPHAALLETKVLKTANDNPGVIVDLATNLRGDRPTLAEIRAMHHEEGTPRIDLTLALVVSLVMVTTLRYIGRGLDDLSLTIIGGLGMSLLMIFRPLLWGLARRK